MALKIQEKISEVVRTVKKLVEECHAHVVAHWGVKDERVDPGYKVGVFAALMVITFVMAAVVSLQVEVFGVVLFEAATHEMDIISELFVIMCQYISMLCLGVVILCGMYYLCTKSKKVKPKGAKKGRNHPNKLFFWIFYTLCFVVALVAIPMIGILCIMSFLIKKRAQTMDNWLNMLIFYTVNLFAFQVSLPILFVCLSSAVNKVGTIVAQYNWTFNGVACFVFAYIVVNLGISEIVLFIMKWSHKRRNKKLREDQHELSQVEYDVKYYRNTHRRMQLTLLVGGLLMVLLGIMPQSWLELRGELINALTAFTVIMMCIDKWKELA